jgi:hypothetical protein
MLFLLTAVVVAGMPSACNRQRDAGSGDRTGQGVGQVLLRVQVDGKYGLIDLTGKTVVSPRFDEVYDFDESDTIIPACVDGRWGFIDRTGTFAIAPDFDGVSSFNEDLAVVRVDDKRGYIDRSGKIVIRPQFEHAFQFSEGLAAVAVASPGRAGHVTWDRLWGYIDKSGSFVVEPTLHDASDFSDGLAVVKKTHEWRSHYIDKRGRTIAGPFEEAWSMSSKMPGMAQVLVHDGEPSGYGIIDRNGDYVIMPEHPSLCERFSEGLVAVGRYAVPHRDGLTIKGYMNTRGELVIPHRYESAWDFSEGRAAVSEDGQTAGFIDKTGEYVAPPIYEDVWDFHDGLAAVKLYGKWGFIDRDGKMVITPKFQAVNRGFQEGLAAVNVGGTELPHGPVDGGKWGYIDKTGAWVVPPTFDHVSLTWEHGVTLVWIGDKRGYINRQGEYIWEPTK